MHDGALEPHGGSPEQQGTFFLSCQSLWRQKQSHLLQRTRLCLVFLYFIFIFFFFMMDELSRADEREMTDEIYNE